VKIHHPAGKSRSDTSRLGLPIQMLSHHEQYTLSEDDARIAQDNNTEPMPSPTERTRPDQAPLAPTRSPQKTTTRACSCETEHRNPRSRRGQITRVEHELQATQSLESTPESSDKTIRDPGVARTRTIRGARHCKPHAWEEVTQI